eukprot:GHVH01011151.1.p1 GENE.GHVH01011151.1~~GHVH01011151.1.p1  ORF type:complete len:235 (-),score=17.96 GHVH01011151.1:320-982(-)
MRPSKITFGVMSRADGSAEVYTGNTHVMAACYGAQSPKFSRCQTLFGMYLDIHINLLNSSGAIRDGVAGIEYTTRKGLSLVLHPHHCQNLVISLHLMVLDDDGGLEAAMLNAAFAALIDARIPMKDSIDPLTQSIWAVSACLTSKNVWLLDPDSAEESEGSVLCTRFVGDTESELVSSTISMKCGLTPEEVEEAVTELYRDAVSRLPAIVRQSLTATETK